MQLHKNPVEATNNNRSKDVHVNCIIYYSSHEKLLKHLILFLQLNTSNPSNREVHDTEWCNSLLSNSHIKHTRITREKRCFSRRTIYLPVCQDLFFLHVVLKTFHSIDFLLMQTRLGLPRVVDMCPAFPLYVVLHFRFISIGLKTFVWVSLVLSNICNRRTTSS